MQSAKQTEMLNNKNKKLYQNVNIRGSSQPATYKGPTASIQLAQIVCCYQWKMGAALLAIVVVVAFIVMQKPVP